jgi:RHS repeat-associated protein
MPMMRTGTAMTQSDAYSFSVASRNDYEFTGKERDNESGLDNFGARYYESYIGRFMTPDWAAKPTSIRYADFKDPPQTLNQYGYVRNNPLFRADLDGHGFWDSVKNCFLYAHCVSDEKIAEDHFARHGNDFGAQPCTRKSHSRK